MTERLNDSVASLRTVLCAPGHWSGAGSPRGPAVSGGGANSQTPYSHGTRRRGLGQQVAVSLQFRPAWTPQAWLPSEPLPTRADPAGEKRALTLSLGRLSLEVGSPHLKRG